MRRRAYETEYAMRGGSILRIERPRLSRSTSNTGKAGGVIPTKGGSSPPQQPIIFSAPRRRAGAQTAPQRATWPPRKRKTTAPPPPLPGTAGPRRATASSAHAFPYIEGRKRRAIPRRGFRLSFRHGKRLRAPDQKRGIPDARARRPPRGTPGASPNSERQTPRAFSAAEPRMLAGREKLGGKDLKTGQRPCRLLHSHDSLRLRLLRSGSPEW